MKMTDDQDYIKWFEGCLIDYHYGHEPSFDGIYIILELDKQPTYTPDFFDFKAYYFNENKNTFFSVTVEDIKNLYESKKDQKIQISNKMYITLVSKK